MRLTLILMMLATGISSTTAFARNCYYSDAISTGDDFWFYNSQPLKIVMAENGAPITLQTDYFRLHIMVDGGKRSITYAYDDPDQELSGSYAPESARTIEDVTSEDALDQINSQTIQLAPGLLLRSEIRCERGPNEQVANGQVGILR